MNEHSSGLPSNPTMATEILLAPIGYVLMGEGLGVLALNHKAVDIGMAVGESMVTYLEEASLTWLRQLIKTSANGSFEARFIDGKQFECHFVLLSSPAYACLWLSDVSELRFVQRQMQSLQRPERKFIYKLDNQVSTTLGYSELVDLMLEENPILSGERLRTIRRYQGEVNSGLHLIENHILREKLGTVPSDTGQQGRQHALLVHTDRQRLEFLIELMQAQQFSVTSFTDVAAAIEFVDLNPEKVSLAVIGNDKDLTSHLLQSNPSLNIFVCTDSQFAILDKRIHIIPDKPLDINVLMKALYDNADGFSE